MIRNLRNAIAVKSNRLKWAQCMRDNSKTRQIQTTIESSSRKLCTTRAIGFIGLATLPTKFDDESHCNSLWGQLAAHSSILSLINPNYTAADWSRE